MLTYPGCSLFLDLGRMYNLVSRITDGLGELKKLLETHIHNQGLAAIEKCGEAALNVRTAFSLKLALRGRVQIHMNLFVSSRTPKFTSRPPWTSTRSTTPWSCLPSTTTPALWRHSTRSVIPLRPVHETPDESERLIHFFFWFYRRVVDSSTTTPSPGWRSRPANLPSCWPDTAILY